MIKKKDIVETGEATFQKMLDDELTEIMKSMRALPVVTEDYPALNAELERLVKAKAALAKIDADAALSRNKSRVDWGVLGPKIAGIVVYGGVMGIFILAERNHAIPQKLIQLLNTILKP